MTWTTSWTATSGSCGKSTGAVSTGAGPSMNRTDQTVSTDETVSAAIAGDEPAFAALTERHRRELHVHCYRMLASVDEDDDAVQETFLNAWRSRSGFEGGSQLRAWLYRIAHNVCLDR